LALSLSRLVCFVKWQACEPDWQLKLMKQSAGIPSAAIGFQLSAFSFSDPRWHTGIA
jgi:hypothetical protein